MTVKAADLEHPNLHGSSSTSTTSTHIQPRNVKMTFLKKKDGNKENKDNENVDIIQYVKNNGIVSLPKYYFKN